MARNSSTVARYGARSSPCSPPASRRRSTCGVALARVAEERDHADPVPPAARISATSRRRPTCWCRSSRRPVGRAPRERQRIAANDAASGTAIIAVDHRRDERRLDPRPADPLDPRARPASGPTSPVAPGRRRTPSSPGRPRTTACRVAAVADVAADRGGGAAGAGADHDPRRHRVPLQGELREDRLGDVVVAAPVGGPLGVGELVHVVAAGLGGQPRAPRRTPCAGSSTRWHRPP